MKSYALLPSLALTAFFLAACGESTTENVTQINQTGMDVVESVKDLPKCEKDNEGEIAWVKGENTSRVCVDGKWFATMEKDSSGASAFTCSTKELDDQRGIKIICNGDSIGVVLNGADGKQGIQGEQGEPGIQGEQGLQGEKGDKGDDGQNGAKGKDGAEGKAGKDGTSCSISARTETAVSISCGDSVIVIDLGTHSETAADTLELDSEKVATSLESLDGYTQKGPFLKGSTVYLYELSDGRTLRQTNGNFMSYITSDDGRYRFNARNLVSQYAMVVVDGNYRNEVTGKKSERPIRLRAITDVTERSSANVNLLTNLEFDRVYYLVTQKKMKVRNAKRQAQAEIFKAFYIDTTGFSGSSEDLDVFGKTDADAALLAISILLQGDRDETDLSVLLTEIANDMETDGKWDGPGSDTLRAKIADWAVYADGQGRLRDFRKNVSDWHLSENEPPAFEKFIRNFVNTEIKLGKCGDETIPVGTVKKIDDTRSKYYAKDYEDTTKTKERFICADADSAWWRLATDIEKDTAGWGTGTNNVYDYEVRPGRVNKNHYYYNEVAGETWRVAEEIEYDTYDYENNRAWANAMDAAEGDIRTGAVTGWKIYVYMDVNHQMTWRIADIVEAQLGGCVAGRDSVGYAHAICLDGGPITACGSAQVDLMESFIEGYYVCKNTGAQGESKWGWVPAEAMEFDTYKLPCIEYGSMVSGLVNNTNKYVCDAVCDENGCRGEFRSAEDLEVQLQLGCTEYNRGYITKEVGEDGTFYKCYDHWKLIQGSLGLESVGYYKNADGATYNVVYAEHQIWMTKNLDVNVEGSYCYDDADSNCTKYGRLYSWDAAMSACPEGWHLPSKTEWVQLTDNGKKGHYLMDPVAWEGTGQSGFDVLPAGYRESSKAVCGDYYCSKGDEAMFWSSETDPEVPNTAYYEHFSTYGDYASWAVLDGGDIERRALSVRCVLD